MPNKAFICNPVSQLERQFVAQERIPTFFFFFFCRFPVDGTVGNAGHHSQMVSWHQKVLRTILKACANNFCKVEMKEQIEVR
jgi:hypothetical protein